MFRYALTLLQSPVKWVPGSFLGRNATKKKVNLKHSNKKFKKPPTSITVHEMLPMQGINN